MKKETNSRDTYHHGNLPEALISEGAILLAERGMDKFSMREVARRAGVAVAAPSHHFGDAKGLLTAIATRGFSKLAEHMDSAATGSVTPEERVVAMCQAYRGMGRSAPGFAAIMFRVELLDESNPPFREQASSAYALFAGAVQQAADQRADAVKVGYAARMLWATMHGLIGLKMIEDLEAEELIRFSVRTVLAGIRQNEPS